MPMIPETVVAMLACARLGRTAHRGLRRVLRRRAAAAASSTATPVRHHRRRRVPPGRAERVEAGRRRGAGRAVPTSSGSWSCAAPGRTSRGTTAATSGGTTSSTASRARTTRRPSTPSTRSTSCTPAAPRPSPRASCTRAGGYLTHVVGHPPPDLRPQARDRRLLDRGRHRLGDGPQLHRLRPAGQRRRRRSCTRAPRTRPAGTAGGSIVEKLQGDHPLHGADHHPHLHEVGRGPARGVTTCPASGCSGRWASPSTPRRGCGTAHTSAATAARSSTPGGRPRPAAS